MRRRSSNSVKIFYPRYDRDYIIETLKRKFKELGKKYNIKLAILFGSYATGKFTASSDIDILVVHDSKKRNLYRRLRIELNLMGIELHIYKINEYRRLKGRINKMIKGGVLLYSSDRL
ncbi:nucleotidyltransferase domain-containing protein [Candidatus Geothermarchaeota archaeon]|nr:MAG: nucleotidyltransferase domain-containing protein [Candidatus Geothermarchaeota archaeon]HEW94300.1 nucleotidyltransferase domain-containing protein [Thermoprotei archaeon]